MNKQKVAIIALSMALFVLVQYFVAEKLIEDNQKKMAEIYQKAYDQGVKDAVNTLYQQTANCQTTSIWIGNSSRQIFDITCLENNSEKLIP